MRKINILHIAFVDSRRDSGISIVVPKHLEHQSAFANVTLLNLNDYIPSNSIGKYNVIYAKDINILRKLLGNINTFDMVVFHEIYRPYFIKAYKELLLSHIPYIIIPHGSLTINAQHVSKSKKLIANHLFFDRFIKNSSCIQYMSETEKNSSIYENHPCFVQGSGVDMVSHKKTHFTEKGLKIIYIGRLDIAVKGLDIILEAVRDNKDLFIKNKIFITIAGSDTKGGQKKIQSFIQNHNLTNIVRLEGPVYGKSKIIKLIEHDIFVQISRTEAQCVGLMEAMRLGLPSIVSPGSTFFEIAKEHNVAIPCIGHSRDLTNAILCAARDKKKLHKISNNASRYISMNFGWINVASTMVEKYQSIIISGTKKP